MEFDTLMAWLNANAGAVLGAATFLALFLAVLGLWQTRRALYVLDRHGKAAQRPILEARLADLESDIWIRLENKGPGHAIITRLDVLGAGPAFPKLIDAMPPLPGGKEWTNFSDDLRGTVVEPEGHRVLLRITLDDHPEDAQIRRDVRDSLAPLTLRLRYKDLHGKTYRLSKPLGFYGGPELRKKIKIEG